MTKAPQRARQATHEGTQTFEQKRRTADRRVKITGQIAQQAHRMPRRALIPLDDVTTCCGGDDALQAKLRVMTRLIAQASTSSRC